MADLHGTVDARFEGVQDAFAAQLDSGNELGASIYVDLDGEAVVDLWGGVAEPGRPWAEDTIVNVWSTTKTMTNLAALLLVDRGQLDPYAPVATYWPEFAANGKADVEVRHLLSHTSGVSGWEQPFAIDDLYDWDKATSHLAAQAPWWEPGTASGYHALNQGHLVGEVIRRIDGRGLKEFVRDELAAPVGADFQIGCAPQDRPRVAPIVPPPALDIDMTRLDPTSVAVKTFTGPLPDPLAANSEAWRDATIGAANGHGNARSVVQIQSAVAQGGGKLISPETVELIFDVQSDGVDLVLGLPIRFGIGYGLLQPGLLPAVPDSKICFWGGWGGSLIIMDLDRRLTIGYVMNKMASGIVGSDRGGAYVQAVYAAVTG
jgi:CubicO group peptidase (beta-lactamase class C family)